MTVRTMGSCASLFTVGALRLEGRERIGELSPIFGHLELPPPGLPAAALDK